MADAEQRRIDWSTAEMRAGTLSVGLTGEAAKGWTKRFDGVVRLLEQSGGSWGKVRARKNAIEVAAVQPGAEEELRHFLESVLLQVNSELVQQGHAHDSDGDRTEREKADAGEDRSEEDGDRQMTTTFRSFAEQGS